MNVRDQDNPVGAHVWIESGRAVAPAPPSWMPMRPDLDAVIETVIVDAYGDVEQYTAFLTIIEEQTPLPAAATLLGAPVTVVGFDFPNEARGLTAACESADAAGEVALADLKAAQCGPATAASRAVTGLTRGRRGRVK
jgi:hypothetical protein